MKHLTETDWNEWLAGTCSGEKAARIQAHCAECSPCQKRMQQAENLRNMLDQWQVNTAGHQIADSVEQAVQAKTILITEAAKQARRRRFWSHAAQVAAAVLIGISLGYLAGRNSADRYIAQQDGAPAVQAKPNYLAALDLQLASDLTWSVLDANHTQPGEDQ